MYQSLQATLLPVTTWKMKKFSSIPDLEILRELLSPIQEISKEPDHGTHMIAPADACADMDHFKDTDRQDTFRQQLEKEINGAPPWHQDASQKAIDRMEKVVKAVKPAYEGFWFQPLTGLPKIVHPFPAV